jgi:predicted CoA-binding protein
MTRTALRDIDDFLHRKRILVVGVSRNPKDFTRTLFRELLKRGYDVSPVNPAVRELDGAPCIARVADAVPPADAVLLLTKPEVTERVALECAEAQVRTVWMYRAVGSGAVSRNAAAFCRSRGMRVIEGECPFMFLENGAWPHRFHARCRMLLGKYPR